MSGQAVNREAVRAWRSFLEAHASLVDALERDLQAERGLPLAFYDVLVHLDAAAEGKLRMQELAERLLLSRSGFTRLCDRMESAGLLQRTRCPSDRRGVYAVITPAGAEALEGAAPVHRRGVEEYFARHLDSADLESLRAMLDRVCEGNRAARTGPTPCREEIGAE
jgi:DNA-binding MarR family transcriptional regulator